MHFSILKKLFLSHFFAIVLVSGSIGTLFYFSAYNSLKKNLQSRLQNSAAIISQSIDAKLLEDIRDESDITNPLYQKYLEQLRRMKKSNPDIAFLYIMRLAKDRVFFVIDSDTTEEQALPGREYTETIPALLAGFKKPSVDDQIYTDEWGSFLSGYCPLKNGQNRYLVGIDMRADEVYQKFRQLHITGILSLLCSIFLALIFSRIMSAHFITPIKLLISRCSAIADGKLDEHIQWRTHDELDSLIHAFNTMSAKLAETRKQNLKASEALAKAKEELEFRVEERTKDLLEVNKELLHENRERDKAEKALAQAARSDPLTGLHNRRAMMEHLHYQTLRYNRDKTPFSILLIDIDHFKPVNDNYGHGVGDQVLIEIANLLHQSIRGQDFVSRWGGDEFLALLSETDIKGGRIVAERIRLKFEEKVFYASHQKQKLTTSIGVTEYSPDKSLDECIKAADTALYQAKKQGNNRVAATNEPPSA